MARISWHPAFVQALAIELEEYRDVLVFESEHQLTTEPLKIDVLIIKKKKDVAIKKTSHRFSGHSMLSNIRAQPITLA